MVIQVHSGADFTVLRQRLIRISRGLKVLNQILRLIPMLIQLASNGVSIILLSHNKNWIMMYVCLLLLYVINIEILYYDVCTVTLLLYFLIKLICL